MNQMKCIILIMNLFLVAAVWGVPVNEAFDGTWPPAGWSTFQSGQGTQTWGRSPVSQPPWNYNAHSRKEHVALGSASRRWLVSPLMFPQGADSVLRFFVKTQIPVLPADTTDDSLYVKLSFGGTSAGSFTETLLALKPGIGGDFGQDFTERRIDLSPYDQRAVRIAFYTVDYDWRDHNVYVDSVRGPLIPTVPGSPTVVSPQNNSLDAPIQSQLEWQNGLWTSDVDVYFSALVAEVGALSPTALVYTGHVIDTLTPPQSFLNGTTYYWRVIERNYLGTVQGPIWSFTTGEGPLEGIYMVGPGGQFSSVNAALTALALSGISGPTTVEIAAGVYDDRLTIPAISGTSPTAILRITNPDSLQPVVFNYSLSTDSCVVLFDQTRYVELDNLEFVAGATAIVHPVQVGSGTHNITVRNCRIRGSGAVLSATDGIHISGSDISELQIIGTEISNVYDGIDASTTDAAAELLIDSCRIESVRRGIVVSRLARTEIRRCDIAVNAGSVEDIAGIQVNTTLPGDSVIIDGNRIHDFVTSGPFARGIRLLPDSATAEILMVNNFIHDFAVTGSSQCRGITLNAGRAALYFNSIDMSDVAASGSVYSFYAWSAPTGSSVKLQNNIFSNREATASAYNLFFLSPLLPVESDYNIFHGTGSNYKLARRTSDAVDLAGWQYLSGLDGQSLSGNPYFADFHDLHLTAAQSALAHQNGLYLPPYAYDIDGEARRIPPDRGADEYEFLAPAADYAIVSMPDTPTQFEIGRVIEIHAVVLNRGSADQLEVPVSLTFAENVIETRLVSLAALEVDTLTFYWFTGESSAVGNLTVRAALSGDSETGNDSLSQSAAVVNMPMAGVYTVGWDGDYATISAAITDAVLRGLSASVEIHIAPGSYEENIVIPALSGARAANTLRLMADPTSESSVAIHSESGAATIILDGADHVQLSGVQIEAVGSNPTAILLQNGAADNRIEQCEIRGPSPLLTTTYGIRVLNGANHRNVIQDCVISNAYRGIRFEGTSTVSDSANIALQNVIAGCVTGIRVDYQSDCRIQSCDISAGFDSSTANSYGIRIGALPAGQSLLLEGNRLHSAKVAAELFAIHAAAAGGAVIAQNNMIYGLNTMGSGSAYGIFIASGSAQLYHNSILLSPISSSSALYGIVDSSVTPVTAQNNIVRAEDSDNNTWCLTRFAGALNSDYNLFDDATNSSLNFHVGRIGSSHYLTLSQWQANSGQDFNSLAGIAGFLHDKDLHIVSTSATANGMGLALPGVSTDFDGDSRGTPPDIGADEYEYVPAANEFAVRLPEQTPTLFLSDSSYVLEAIVCNYGSLPQSDVPVSLLFNDLLQQQLFVSLAPAETDTVQFSWTAPTTELLQGELTVRSELIGDEIPGDNAASLTVSIVGSPLTGDYELGGSSPSFASLSDATRHLTLRGVSGPVTIGVHPGLYVDVVEFAPIAGASALSPVSIVALDTMSRPVFTYAAGEQLILLDGAAHVRLSGLELHAPIEGSAVLRIQGGSNNVHVENCILIGSDSTSSYTYGLVVDGSECNDNWIQGCSVQGAFTGISLNGASGTASGNRVTGCHIGGVRYGVSVFRQMDALIEHNDIRAGFPTGDVAPCYGVLIGTLGANGSVTVNANLLHDFADQSSSTTNRAVGIYSAPGGSAVATITNNFVVGFAGVHNLKINGLYLSAGVNRVYHNSILLENDSNINQIACAYISTGSSHEFKNNIFVSRAPSISSYGIYHSTGEGLISDYNLIYGSSPVFVTGRVGSLSYIELADWQAAAYDLNSIAAEPGFVSSSDLHIQVDSGAVSGRGISLAEVSVDYDGESRQVPPDIGADEYDYDPNPDMVTDLSAILTSEGLYLSWSPSNRARSYHIYAAVDPDNIFAPENLIATVTETTYLSPDPQLFSRRHFVVTADSAP